MTPTSKWVTHSYLTTSRSACYRSNYKYKDGWAPCLTCFMSGRPNHPYTCNSIGNILSWSITSIPPRARELPSQTQTWNMKLEPQKISSIKCVVSLRPRTTILYTISLGFMFHFCVSCLTRAQPNQLKQLPLRGIRILTSLNQTISSWTNFSFVKYNLFVTGLLLNGLMLP